MIVVLFSTYCHKTMTIKKSFWTWTVKSMKNGLNIFHVYLANMANLIPNFQLVQTKKEKNTFYIWPVVLGDQNGVCHREMVNSNAMQHEKNPFRNKIKKKEKKLASLFRFEIFMPTVSFDGHSSRINNGQLVQEGGRKGRGALQIKSSEDTI